MARDSRMLTNDHLKRIEGSLRRLADLEYELQVAEQGGEDVKDYREIRQVLMDGFSRMKKAHFPKGKKS